MINWLAVGLGGFIGSGVRYGFSLWLRRFPSFPFGTLISNLLAALAIGLIMGVERQTGALTPRMRLFLTTGLLGGLSTFSTFSLETADMLERGEYLSAGGNILLNLVLCLVLVRAGLVIAKAAAGA